MIHVFNPANSVLSLSKAPSTPLCWSWLTLQGKDAKDFLHRLSTAQVKYLQVGQGTPGCFLSAQGKIRAYFHLWNYAEDEYGFELDAGDGSWKKEFLAFIDQYTFSEKFILTDTATGPQDSPETFESRWLFIESDSIPAHFPQTPHQTLATENLIRLCNHGKKDYSRTWITAWGKRATLDSWLASEFSELKEIDYAQIEEWRIQSLRPRAGAEMTENTMPVEIGLSDSVAENKGCYPGQEVIEKIISLGSPPRRLAQITGKAPIPEVGQLIFNLAEPAIEVGQITSVTPTSAEASSYTALGWIKKIHAKEGLTVRIGTEQNALKTEGTILKIAPYEA